MHRLLILTFVLVFSSCIPTQIAPKFKNKDYKVTKAKKFERSLEREMAYIFKDSKDAEEFYNFINKKFQLHHKDVGINVPFQLNNETLYLSYYEVSRNDSSINLPLVAIDAKRQSNGNSPLFERSHTSSNEHWYIVLTVYDENIRNCLKDSHRLKDKTIEYLKVLQIEYLNTQNYNELLLNKKS